MKRNNRKSGRRRLFGVILLLLAVLCAAGFLGYRFLRVTEVAVVGNRAVKTGAIIERSGIETGKHLLALDKDEIRQRIEEDPYLILKNISFHLPGTVVLTVEERTVEAVVQYLERAIFIDRTGRVLDIRTGADLTGILVVKGIAVSGCAVGEQLAVYDEYQLEALEVLLENLVDGGQYSRYAEADFTNVMDIVLTTHEGMTVRIGQAHDLERKLLLADSVIAELNGKGIRKGTLSVTDSAAAAYAPEPTATPAPEESPSPEEDEAVPDGAEETPLPTDDVPAPEEQPQD